MNKIIVNSLVPGTYFTEKVYLEDKYILLSPETPITKELVNRLQKWGYKTVQTVGEQVNSPVIDLDAPAQSSVNLNADIKESEKLKEVQVFINDLLNFTEKTFTDFVTKNSLPIQPLSDKIKELIDVIRNRKKYILRLSDIQEDEKNYIVVHSVKTAILAVALGINLKMMNHRLIELGTSALLHTIGMIRLPPQLYLSKKKLGPQEKKAITAHPVLGFKILKSFNFPTSICLAVLECQEHIDGSGYPRGITGEKISLYAKIIRISSSFSALTSPRPHRGALDGHQGILDMLKMSGSIYDEGLLKLLIINLSIYPIGSYVKLSNGSIGMVVETDEKNVKTPHVKLLFTETGERFNDTVIIDTSDEQYRITETIKPEKISQIASP
ncbi:MAG: HD-GYP domain-containing protein [Spirochaetia bacterium]